MNKKKLGIIGIIIALTAIAGYYQLASKSKSSFVAQTTAAVQGASSNKGNNTQAAIYTMAEVTQNDNANSCWSVVNNNVYDLTNWVNQHPGGSFRILLMCGKDSSSLYNAQHRFSRKANNSLENYLIGELSTTT